MNRPRLVALLVAVAVAAPVLTATASAGPDLCLYLSGRYGVCLPY